MVFPKIVDTNFTKKSWKYLKIGTVVYVLLYDKFFRNNLIISKHLTYVYGMYSQVYWSKANLNNTCPWYLSTTVMSLLLFQFNDGCKNSVPWESPSVYTSTCRGTPMMTNDPSATIEYWHAPRVFWGYNKWIFLNLMGIDVLIDRNEIVL